MRMRFLFFLLGLLFLALDLPSGAIAQGNERLANLTLLVWPEYDDPGVLVQYDGEIAVKENFPRELSMLVPTGARVIATAYVDTKGDMLNTDPWKTKDAGDGFSLVTFSLPAPHFHLEFYYSPLQGAPDKTMDFVYKAASPADKVRLEIQEPLKADKFRTTPATTNQITRMHDFKYHIFDFPSLDAGQILRVQVSYTKTDPAPSIAYITVPEQASTEPLPSSNIILPIALVATGLAVGLLGTLAWRSRRSKTLSAAYASTRNMPKRNRRRVATIFCSQCGHGLGADDNFCPQCGTRRRG